MVQSFKIAVRFPYQPHEEILSLRMYVTDLDTWNEKAVDITKSSV